MHSYGCRVIQRILEHCRPEDISEILDELLGNIMNLIVDQFGNYVIQHIIAHCGQQERSRIIEVVNNNIFMLSKHKFASNVAERCIKHSTAEERQMLFESAFGEIPHDFVGSLNDFSQQNSNSNNSHNNNSYFNSQLFNMMKDQYANYVIQKMIDCANSNQRAFMLDKVRTYSGNLKKYTHGKHLINKLDRYLYSSTSATMGSFKASNATNVATNNNSSDCGEFNDNNQSKTSISLNKVMRVYGSNNSNASNGNNNNGLRSNFLSADALENFPPLGQIASPSTMSPNDVIRNWSRTGLFSFKITRATV